MEVIRIIYVIVSSFFYPPSLEIRDSDTMLTGGFKVWSNFEIADMDFWRGEAYTAFFNYLDSLGGFYYEVRPSLPFLLIYYTDIDLIVLAIQRWGDAPVHSIAAALFAPKDKLHFFNEIGYEHAPYTHCPRGEDTWTKGRCGCDPKQSFGEFAGWFRFG
jgi:alpha 1,2-mannosyltransferase